MTDREVMQIALEWFHWFEHGTNQNDANVLEVENALRAALSQPEPEPVAWEQFYEHLAGPNYTAPLKREWVGLTDDDIQGIHYQIKTKGMGVYSTEDIYRAIEAKLKEKNNG